MKPNRTTLAGWFPAIILPTATAIQLFDIIGSAAEDVNPVTWFLFGLANIGAYLFTEKYLSLLALLSFGLTAFLDFIIVGILLFN